eukprot:SAG11_NODE_1141_length_5707_cov_14.979315_6_plen_131_part_00
MVPPSLRVWFVVHFFADMLFALPLFFAPVWTLQLLGWTMVDPAATRLVAAALFGIGIESLLGRNADVEAFRAMLNLKVIWASTATVGLGLSALQGSPPMTWGFFGIFLSFLCLWSFYRLRLGTENAPSED